MSARYPIDEAADAINVLMVERHKARARVLTAESLVAEATALATDIERRMAIAQADHARLVLEARTVPRHAAPKDHVCFCAHCKAERSAAAN